MSADQEFRKELRTMVLFTLCICLRNVLTLLAKWKCGDQNIRYGLVFTAIVVSVFMGYIWWTGKRKTGWETGNELIWWNWLRPVHAAVWATFAYQMATQCTTAWKLLQADIWLGYIGRYLTNLFIE